MPAHVRTQIRDAAKAAVLNLPTTGTRVYTGQTRPLAADHDPTLLVFTPNETSARTARREGSPILERPVSLIIEARTSTATPPDDLLDTIAVEVEQAMWAALDGALGALLLNLQFVSTEQRVEAQGTKHVGAMRMEYRATYRTAEGQPTATA